MYSLLVKIVVVSAFAQLGLSLIDLLPCRTGQGVSKLNESSRKILKIEWKPLTVFPEEAKRFR